MIQAFACSNVSIYNQTRVVSLRCVTAREITEAYQTHYSRPEPPLLVYRVSSEPGVITKETKFKWAERLDRNTQSASTALKKAQEGYMRGFDSRMRKQKQRIRAGHYVSLRRDCTSVADGPAHKPAPVADGLYRVRGITDDTWVLYETKRELLGRDVLPAMQASPAYRRASESSISVWDIDGVRSRTEGSAPELDPRSVYYSSDSVSNSLDQLTEHGATSSPVDDTTGGTAASCRSSRLLAKVTQKESPVHDCALLIESDSADDASACRSARSTGSSIAVMRHRRFDPSNGDNGSCTRTAKPCRRGGQSLSSPSRKGYRRRTTSISLETNEASQ